MRVTRKISMYACAAFLTVAVGCQEMKDNPRTTGTIGGAALGAGAGALIDHDKPGRGAIIGGVIGGAVGNVGGEVYKQNRKKDDDREDYNHDYRDGENRHYRDDRDY